MLHKPVKLDRTVSKNNFNYSFVVIFFSKTKFASTVLRHRNETFVRGKAFMRYFGGKILSRILKLFHIADCKNTQGKKIGYQNV